ncbi:hypothetical protein A2767_02135 [Candidatus Roizmanbacteria bacterium RIFCSPHIGHO2_01_FULL_35_10]|uniref:Uncharacterized protein n=1 Tax=Candidatus Roizmanbacteria bacterium RIFCSPLOWO2_01_FULL_35_13 TaxID=1802055 RepID=A0A1F7I7A6_9BACT|nr:MAG: hypothetical protein A2767_02135 [Candidatus Roizmanbacteria bacterium RIFCSPHIGHO2_01_FULL_35_10]OGK39260.1 MAG: hypothetical protein A3A74_07555 [Candidatus Roizmanbacteria bacterium RIFCSPLOWO2_01_FULL_35_13]
MENSLIQLLPQLTRKEIVGYSLMLFGGSLMISQAFLHKKLNWRIPIMELAGGNLAMLGAGMVNSSPEITISILGIGGLLASTVIDPFLWSKGIASSERYLINSNLIIYSIRTNGLFTFNLMATYLTSVNFLR